MPIQICHCDLHMLNVLVDEEKPIITSVIDFGTNVRPNYRFIEIISTMKYMHRTCPTEEISSERFLADTLLFLKNYN